MPQFLTSSLLTPDFLGESRSPLFRRSNAEVRLGSHVDRFCSIFGKRGGNRFAGIMNAAEALMGHQLGQHWCL